MSQPNRILLNETDLEPAGSPQAFALHRAALEWQLDRPILIGSKADMLSRDKIEVDPYEHQVKNLMTFCRLAPVALLADDVGLGKTISAGLILSELILRKKVRKALVVCPAILVAQWEQELTNKFGLCVVKATSKNLSEVVRLERGVVVATYDIASKHFEALGRAGIQMIILDEAHRLRRLHGSGRKPQMAIRIREGLEQRLFKFVLLLTATPIQNRVWDLYSLVDILTVAKGHRHPLGTPAEFREKYLKDQKALQIHPHLLPEFRAHVRRYIVRTRRADAELAFPGRKVELRRVQATDVERELLRLLGRHLDKLEVVQQISLGQALMSSPEALVAQLETTVLKAPHLDECLNEARKLTAIGQPSAKMLGLDLILDALQQARPNDFRLVIFTVRRETQRVIGALLEKKGISHGFISGGSTPKNRQAIDRFTKEPPEANVIVSTDAGAEGVNLQAGNVLVNYDLPWNPMIMEQRIGRIQRLGSKHEVVTILNLVVGGSVEERIVARLTEKLQLIGDAVGEIDAILESTSAGTDSKDGDAGSSFEAMIRKLVVESLAGKDTDEEVRLKEASIDKAKLLFDQHQAVIEKQLGKLDELHTSGPSLPTLPVREPAMPFETFVLGAFQEEGAVVTRSSSGLLDIVPKKGRRFQAFLGVEAHGNVAAYAPGEPAFESLAARWAVQHGALLYDRRGAGEQAPNAIAARWCEQIAGAVLHGARQVASHTRFQGEVDCVARAGITHDSYETVVSVALCPDGHARIPYDQPDSSLLAERAQASLLFDGITQVIEATVGKDPGIREFCRFYDERRKEDLLRVEPGSSAAKYVQDSLTPTLQATIVGLRGQRYEVVRMHLTVEMDGAVPLYETEVEIVPPTSQVVEAPELETCEQSRRRVPTSWLEACCVSNRRVLRHLLQKSERSGKRALPEHFARSVLTNKSLLASEMEKSAVSGAPAEPELLETSEMSQRKGLPKEIARCDLTGTKVLLDELVKSQVSGRMLRSDQQVASAISGVIGHLTELVKCELSNTHVLSTEGGRSELSHRWVRQDWLVPSQRPPHRVGARTEMVQCAHTGKWLLSDEVVRSAASGKLVDASLLVKSGASDLRALPEELIVCAASTMRVLPQETEICVVTGQRAVRGRMVKSEVKNSSSYMLPGREVRSAISHRPMAPNEVYVCPWLGDHIFPQEAVACSRTKLWVAPRALNANGELAALRRVLDNPSQGQSAPDIVEWLARIKFFGVRVPKSASAISSPSGQLRAVVVKAKHWFWPTTSTDFIVARSPVNGELTMTWSGQGR